MNKAMNDRLSAEETFLPVSIAVISKDRREYLDQLVYSIGRLDYPDDLIQLVIVEEADDPYDRVFPGYVTYDWIPRRNLGLGFARQRSVDLCNHELIAFTDDDCIVTSSWLKNLLKPLCDEKIGGSAGAVFAQPTGSIGLAEIVLGFPGGGLKKYHAAAGKTMATKHLSTCNCAYRKKVIIACGGFLGLGSEDYELAERVGEKHSCVYVPDALVYHRARGAVLAIFRWFVCRGRQQIYLIDAFSKGRYQRIFWNLSTSLCLRFLCLMIILGVSGALVYLPIILGAYYLFLAGRYRYSFRYHGSIPLVLVTPIVKIVMDTGFDWGKFRQLLERKQESRGKS